MDALCDGLFHQEWTRRQDIHLWGESLWTPRNNSTQSTVQDIKFLWNKFFALWNRRNKLVHGSMEQSIQQLKIDRYKSTIETMFHYKDRLLAADRQYMFQNLTEVEEFL
eukprot:5383753-Ditylum_brightwellii.AAC.1